MASTRTISEKLKDGCVRAIVMTKSAMIFGATFSTANSLVAGASGAIGAVKIGLDVKDTTYACLFGGAIVGGFFGAALGLKIGYEKEIPANTALCDAFNINTVEDNRDNSYRRV